MAITVKRKTAAAIKSLIMIMKKRNKSFYFS